MKENKIENITEKEKRKKTKTTIKRKYDQSLLLSLNYINLPTLHSMDHLL